MHLADEVVIHVGLSGAHDAISNIENVHCIGWRLTIINANSMTDTIQWTFHHIVALRTAAEDFVAGKRHRGLQGIREFERRVSIKRLANCDMAHTIRYKLTYVASKTH